MFRQLLNRWRLPIVGLFGLALGLSGILAAALLAGTTAPFKTCALPDDAERGRVWAPTCKGCHDIAAAQPAVYTVGGKSGGGPNLQNVYGSLAGTMPKPFKPGPGYNGPYPPLAVARDAGLSGLMKLFSSI